MTKEKAMEKYNQGLFACFYRINFIPTVTKHVTKKKSQNFNSISVFYLQYVYP